MTVTITIFDPGYKGRRLAKHEALMPAEARELCGVYRGLGYPESCILIETDKKQVAA